MNCYGFFQNHYNTPCILSFWQLPEDCLLRGMKLRVADPMLAVTDFAVKQLLVTVKL